jgi:hypothetical protein
LCSRISHSMRWPLIVTDTTLPDPQDSPALDYVMRYPAPVDDDGDGPAYVAATAAGALLGPDLHGPLEPAGELPGSGRCAPSLIEQLRQRALYGSSSDEDELGERDWQSMVSGRGGAPGGCLGDGK